MKNASLLALYKLKTNKIIICRDVLFKENASYNWNDEKFAKGIALLDDEQNKEKVFVTTGSPPSSPNPSSS